MGTRGTAPWDNDYAADWLGELVDDTGLAERVEQTLQLEEAEVDPEEIRAAVAVLLLLGHPYVWPIERLESDLHLGIAKLEEIKPFFGGQEQFLLSVEAEIELLSARLQRLQANQSGQPQPEVSDSIKWWRF